MATVTHKMLADSRGALKTSLATSKKNIEALMPKYKKACETLAAKIRDYNARQKDFDRSDTAKNGERLDNALDALKEAHSVYSNVREELMRLHAAALVEFGAIVEMADQVSLTEGDKSRAEREKYVHYYTDLLSRNSKSLDSLTIPTCLTLPKKESEDEGEKRAADLVPPVAAPTAGVTSVNIAPITLDVSGIVERAISATIDKLNVGMERKIEEYLAGLALPVPTVSTEPAQDARGPELGAVADAMKTVMGYEEQIVERIRGICDTLTTIIDGLVSLTSSAAELGEKQQQLAALQRQINELQRQTARDQQGVAVNQRLIADEQRAVSAETLSLLGSVREKNKPSK